MNKMSQARSYPPLLRPKWFSPRRYPWRYDQKPCQVLPGLQCEACDRAATHHVYYVERSDQQELSHLFLCFGHTRLTRDSWAELFGMIDRKIERRVNGNERGS